MLKKFLILCLRTSPLNEFKIQPILLLYLRSLKEINSSNYKNGLYNIEWFLSNVKKVYFKYFDVLIEDQDRQWAAHVCCQL